MPYKRYLLAFVFAFLLAFVLGSIWYVYFGYNTEITWPENIVDVYASISFWRGLGIWTGLYFLLVTLPIALLREKLGLSK